jgi:hypothetical protein
MLKSSLALGLSLLMITSANAQSSTHCLTDELVVFSCSMGKKTASVCASTSYSPTEGYLQYRFGAIGNIEMTYPPDRRHPKGAFTAFYATPVMDDGSRAMVVSLEFGVNDYGYELSTFAKQETSETTLTVSRAGKTLATLTCQPPTIINPSLSYMSVLSTFGLD